VPRIAVIEDGTELARQTDADITGCFEQCCSLLSADGPTFSAQVFTDEAAGYLIERVNPDEHACLVVASNALNSGQIERALERRRAQLRSYVDRGGGLMILHQMTESLAAVVPDELCPVIADRASKRGEHVATAYDPGDQLLHFPVPVPLARFVDGGLPGPPSLFYKAMPAHGLPTTLKPVLAYGDEVLVARTYDHVEQRVVIATLPLDWQRAVELLANAIRFACLGRPRRMVWRESAGARRSMLMKWLSLDGGASIRPAPSDGQDLGPTDRWLLEHVNVTVVPPTRFDAARRRDEVRGFLGNGGTLLSMEDLSSDVASQVTALVGAYTERQLAARLYGELRAVTGWDAVDYAFELRNIVTAVALLWENPANRTAAAVSPRELAWLVGGLRERLSDDRHREDLSSSIALLQTLAFLSERAVDRKLYAWMDGDPRRSRFDVGLQIRAATALARRQPDPGFADAALDALRVRPNTASFAAVVRILDALAVLDQAGLLVAEPGTVADLTAQLCGLLEDEPAEPGVGWLSVEATADICRGMVAVLSRLPEDATDLASRAADQVGTASSILRQALRRYERNRKAVAWRARVTHAIVLIDRHFPIGLQRLASLDWPEPPDSDSSEAPTGTLPAGDAAAVAATAGDRSLVEQLAVENKVLRDLERQCRDARLAAQLGRATATLGTTVLIGAPFVYLLLRIGFASPAALIGNITVVTTMLLGIVAGVFALLRRWYLLAGPAMRIHDWIGRTVPMFSGLSQLRRK
jgi:hypothetical protein